MKDRKLEINNIIKNFVKNKSIPYANAITKIKKRQKRLLPTKKTLSSKVNHFQQIDSNNTLKQSRRKMIPSKLTLEELDNYFQTATYVERYMPSPLNMKNKKDRNVHLNRQTLWYFL